MSRPATTVFIATTLDGFIARPDGSLDWLPTEPAPEDGETDYGYGELMTEVDVLLMGRKTLETVLAFEGPWPYTLPVVVLSTALTEDALPEGLRDRVSVLSGEPAEVLEELGRRGFKSVYVDGGSTIQGFLRTGLIDRLVLTRVPVLIGQGIPLFGPMEGDVHLEHEGGENWPSGMSQSRYRVRR